MKKLHVLTFAALWLGFFSLPVLQTGCASGGLTVSDQGKVVAKAAVEIAVSEVVANNPSKASEIVSIATQIKAIAGTDGFNTVDLLVEAIRVKANIAALPPQQQILANLLIDTIATQLKAKIPNGQINSANLVLVSELAGWVIEGASLVTVKS
jgi:hypothetical protein